MYAYACVCIYIYIYIYIYYMCIYIYIYIYRERERERLLPPEVRGVPTRAGCDLGGAKFNHAKGGARVYIHSITSSTILRMILSYEKYNVI